MNRVKPEYLLLGALIVIFTLGFWSVGTAIQRLDVRILRNRSDIAAMSTRVIERWTRGEHTQWAQEFGRLNPSLKVPPVSPAPGMPAIPQLPSERRGAGHGRTP